MPKQTVTLEGKAYVIVPQDEYDALETLAGMPALPEPLPDGNYPAREYMRASIARDVIRDRVRLRLTQAELARRAGIRVETLCRIERGKTTPSVESIDKIDRALKAAEAEAPNKPKRKRKAAKRK